MSRDLLREHNITAKQLREMYLELGNAKKVAQALGAGYKAVRQHLRKAGVSLKPGKPLGARGGGYHTSCLAKWLRAHPGQGLPRSMKKIAELTDCTKNEIKTYLWRRRQSISKQVKRLHFQASLGGLTDTTGAYVPFHAWREIEEVKVQLYSFEIDLKVLLRTGYVRHFHAKSYQWLRLQLAEPDPHLPEEQRSSIESPSNSLPD